MKELILLIATTLFIVSFSFKKNPIFGRKLTLVFQTQEAGIKEDEVFCICFAKNYYNFIQNNKFFHYF